MAFLRVIEVFPPVFKAAHGRNDVDYEAKLEALANDVRGIRKVADLILVANLKDTSLLKLSAVTVASYIKKETGVESAPTIVARDANRPQLLSEILTAYSIGLRSIMLAWGDRYGRRDGARNAYDFRNLSEVISEAKNIGQRSGIEPRILAPITLSTHRDVFSVKLGKERVGAGSSFLLAQPPTTDPGETFDEHRKTVESSGLKSRVLLNVFPFRGKVDVIDCESHFGWKLPPRLHTTAAKGRSALIREEREVVRRLRDEGFPGVYVSTRGTPSVAADILR